MKAAILSLLLGVGLGIKCNWQTPSYKLDKDGAWIDLNVDWPGIEWSGLRECGLGFYPDKWSCGSTKFAGSFTKTEKNWWTGKDVETSWTYESETKGCTPSAVCEKLSGGVDGCQTAKYSFEKWFPRSCNATADYDAITEDYEASVTLSCCQTDGNYCNADEDYSGCTEVGGFSTYITELNTCWNDYKRTFMKELLCDNDGIPNRDILSWGQNCTEEDGSWKKSLRSKLACRYKPTCAQEMRDTMLEFAECSCTAAQNGGYTGEFIGTAMQQNWQRFCPNVEISCASDTGLAQLLYKYWVIKYKLIVGLAKDAISDEIVAKIKAKIAERLNVDPITITITIGGTPSTTSTTRRLLADETVVTADVAVEDENTKVYVENNVDDTLASDIGTDIGATTTKDSVEADEASDLTEGSYSGANIWNIHIAALVVAIASVFN